MPFLVALTVVAVTVAVVALQNGHAVTVAVLFWQFERRWPSSSSARRWPAS